MIFFYITFIFFYININNILLQRPMKYFINFPFTTSRLKDSKHHFVLAYLPVNLKKIRLRQFSIWAPIFQNFILRITNFFLQKHSIRENAWREHLFQFYQCSIHCFQVSTDCGFWYVIWIRKNIAYIVNIGNYA